MFQAQAQVPRPIRALGASQAQDDDRLMREIVSGNAEAFEELYDRFYPRAYRVARGVCRDDGRAEDAVQEAFIAIWRSAGTYRAERGGLASWLLTLVRHRAIDVARENSRHADRRAGEEKTVLHAVPGVLADRVVDRDRAARLRSFLQLLPEAQEEVVALAFYGQLSHAEIAAQLRLAPGTVKGRMRLGLGRLRVSIDDARASERLRVALASAFCRGDLEGAHRVIAEAITQMPAVTMLDDVFAPAMHQIGSLWEASEITVADEHLATAVCHRLLAEISPALRTAPARSRETVLLVTAAPEQHTLGLLMAREVLHGAGYDTLPLGSGASEAALTAALIRHRPAVVALSSSMPFPASLAATANLIHESLPAARLITGGATARHLPSEITARHVERLDGMVDAIRELLNPSRLSPTALAAGTEGAISDAPAPYARSNSATRAS